MTVARQPGDPPVKRPRLPELREFDAARDKIEDEALLESLRVHGVDLSERRARLVELVGCELRQTSLAGSRLERLALLDVVLDGCDLSSLVVDHAAFTRTAIGGCRAIGLSAPGALLREVVLRDCLLDMSAFRFATLTNTLFVDCRLRQADFVGCDLTKAAFTRCDLTGAEFSQVKAKGAHFVDCTWDAVRGFTSLRGARLVVSSPVDADVLLRTMAADAGILLADPDLDAG